MTYINERYIFKYKNVSATLFIYDGILRSVSIYSSDNSVSIYVDEDADSEIFNAVLDIVKKIARKAEKVYHELEYKTHEVW